MSLFARLCWIGSLIVAFLLGGLIASWWNTAFFMKHAAFTTAAESSFRVERLCMLRLGRVDDAIGREEMFLDNAVHSVSFTVPDATKLSGDGLRAWQVVKMYRERVPSTNPTSGAAVNAWLAKVPPLARKTGNPSCASAITEFLNERKETAETGS